MKYQIWDKKTNVVTPVGEVLTPAQWIERYPIAGVDGVDLVISSGVINGAICNEYSSFIEIFDSQMRVSGIEKYEDGIPEDLSKQDVLDYISEFEDFMSKLAVAEKNAVSPEERIAAALEAQVMLAMPDEEV